LFDRAKRILAGQEGRTDAVRALVAPHQRRFLDIHFEDDVALIKLWRTGQITEREEESGQRAEDQDPQFLKNRVPEMAEVEALVARLVTDPT
jgi:hypothetical protein